MHDHNLQSWPGKIIKSNIRCEIKASEPLVPYRETVLTPNSGAVGPGSNDNKGKKDFSSLDLFYEFSYGKFCYCEFHIFSLLLFFLFLFLFLFLPLSLSYPLSLSFSFSYSLSLSFLLSSSSYFSFVPSVSVSVSFFFLTLYLFPSLPYLHLNLSRLLLLSISQVSALRYFLPPGGIYQDCVMLFKAV